MNTRFISLMGSPDASEGTNTQSNYSTARSPKTALLFEAAHTVLLPLVRFGGDMPPKEDSSEADGTVGCSVQE